MDIEQLAQAGPTGVVGIIAAFLLKALLGREAEMRAEIQSLREEMGALHRHQQSLRTALAQNGTLTAPQVAELQ